MHRLSRPLALALAWSASAAALAAAEPVAYRSDSLPVHDQFTASVRIAGTWHPAQVLNAAVERRGTKPKGLMGFVRIGADGPVSVRVRNSGDASRPAVRPARLGLTAVADGDGWRIELPGAVHAVAEWASRKNEPIAIFVDPPLAAPAAAEDALVFGPGTHRPDWGPWVILGGDDVLAPAQAEVVCPADLGVRYVVESAEHRNGPWTISVDQRAAPHRDGRRHPLTTAARWWRLRLMGNDIAVSSTQRIGFTKVLEFALLDAEGGRLAPAQSYGAANGWRNAIDGKPDTSYAVSGSESAFLPPWIRHVHVAGDAVVHRGFNAYGIRGLRWTGNGIVCGTEMDHRLDHTSKDLIARSRLMYHHDCDGAQFSGITILDSPHTGLMLLNTTEARVERVKVLCWNLNTDGIVANGCDNLAISRCFVRNGDDCIVFKNHQWGGHGDLRDITVSDCVLWSDLSHALMVGPECADSTPPQVAERIRCERIDVLDHYASYKSYRGVMGVMTSAGGIARDIVFRDIVVERMASSGFVFNVRTEKNEWASGDGGAISGLVFEDIQVPGGEDPAEFRGVNAGSTVSDVLIRNYRRAGTPVRTEAEANLTTNAWVADLRVEFDAGAP